MEKTTGRQPWLRVGWENVLRQLVKSCTPEAPTTQRDGAVWEPTQPPRRPQLVCLVSCALPGRLVCDLHIRQQPQQGSGVQMVAFSHLLN